MAAQVALKRQQAAEDAIALGLRAISGETSRLNYLPPGPVWAGFSSGLGSGTPTVSNTDQHKPSQTDDDDDDDDDIDVNGGR